MITALPVNATDTPALSRGKAWALALTATLTMAVSYFDRQTLAAIAPTVTKAFGISETAYGWLISAFSIAYLCGSPISGWLIDRIGGRRGLVGAVLAWSAVAALHALAPGFGVLFALRIALGLTEAPSFPGAAQTIQRALPPSDRERGFGVLFTGSSIGAMLAPPLAVALMDRWGYKAAFVGTALIGLLWIPAWVALTFKSPAREVLDRPADVASAAPRPGLVEVLRHPAVLRGVLPILASAPAIGFMLNWGAKYLVATHGLTQSQVKPYLVIPPLFYDAGAVLFGHLASKRLAQRGHAPERLLFSIAFGLALLMGALPLARTPGVAMLIAGVAMGGGSALFALLTADMLARVPPSAVSSAGGICAAAQSVAYIAASPILGKLIDTTGGYTVPFLVLAGWTIPGCVGWLIWDPPPRVDGA
jgi:ACS family hexuronate transporter-like MFS transporter